jgi:hypothetical protein
LNWFNLKSESVVFSPLSFLLTNQVAGFSSIVFVGQENQPTKRTKKKSGRLIGVAILALRMSIFGL